MQDIWKSWVELKKISRDKKVVLWGRSEDWVPKTVPKIECDYIIDRNMAYSGTTFSGLTVFQPEKLLNEIKDDIYIVITGGVYESICASIDELGFIPGRHYCVTPEIRDWGLLQEIREYDKNIIVSCSDYGEKGKKRSSPLGGGIYICNTKDNTLIKKIGGHFRQIIFVDNFYYVTEFVEKKIYVLDSDFSVVNRLNIDQSTDMNEKPNGCGIAYHDGMELFFVANAGSDHINIYEKNNFRCIEKIQISDKFSKYGNGQHHINDICIADDNLIVSCFSISGNWKRGILDGGMISFDLNNINKGFDVLTDGLWMPHSVQYIDGNICYLDSMRGDFWVGNKKVEGNFPGFARGLTYDGRFYYIGQSEDMYMSRLFGVKSNIMCNAGVYLFDIDNKVSRFYSFPFLMNVHDLLIQ
jgi:hypothetical protein